MYQTPCDDDFLFWEVRCHIVTLTGCYAATNSCLVSVTGKLDSFHSTRQSFYLNKNSASEVDGRSTGGK